MRGHRHRVCQIVRISGMRYFSIYIFFIRKNKILLMNLPKHKLCVAGCAQNI